MKSSARSQPRPLTPHLRIYRLTFTMMMSIAHRITGASLYMGTLLLAWWLLAAAKGPETYATFQDFADGWLGKVILLGYTWAIIHHLLGGLRHPIGPFLGALVFVLMQNFAVDLVDRERFNLLIGGVFLLIVLFSPDGLLGWWARGRAYLTARSAQSRLSEPATPRGRGIA